MRQYNLGDIHAWTTEERADRKPEAAALSARDRLLDTLSQQLEQDRKLPQPNALSPGSPERLVAEARQRRIGQLATTLGYQPAGREAVTEVVRDRLLDAAGVTPMVKMGVAAMGEPSDVAGERQPDAFQPKSRKQRELGLGRDGRDGGRGFGLGFDLAG